MTIKKISAFFMVLIMTFSIISGVYALNTKNNNLVLTNITICNNTVCNEFSPFNTTVICVSMSGDDGNDGLTLDTAKKTIQCAINTVADKGIVYVATGTYHENLKINKNVSIINPHYSEFYNNKEYTTINSSSEDRGVIVEKGNNVHIERMVITGGGLYNNGQMTIASSKVLHNKNHGITNTGNLTISYSEISNNENNGITNTGNLIITDCSMIQNNKNEGVINSGNANITYSGISGNENGGIINSGNANITYSGISGNGNGGIINSGNLILINSKILNNGNKRPDSGGIYNSRAMTIINSKIRHNKGNTGGIYNRGILSIQDSLIDHNTGTIGGGICNNKKLNITNSYIHANQATMMGGGIYNCFDDLQTINYRITNNNGSKSCGICKTLPCNNYDNFLSIVNCSIENNNAGRSGGGINSWSGLNIINSTIIGNTVIISSLLGSYNTDQVNCGGGIFVDGDLTVINCKIKCNKALKGGGIYHSNMCDLLTTHIVDSKITNNKALKGGGIYHKGDIILKNVKIKDNFAFQYSAIYNTNGYIFQDDNTEINIPLKKV